MLLLFISNTYIYKKNCATCSLVFRATSRFLQIFEQDAHAFTRRLNGVLTPGPVCYVAKIDAFVVGNSQMGVDCYKYQVSNTMSEAVAPTARAPCSYREVCGKSAHYCGAARHRGV